MCVSERGVQSVAWEIATRFATMGRGGRSDTHQPDVNPVHVRAVGRMPDEARNGHGEQYGGEHHVEQLKGPRALDCNEEVEVKREPNVWHVAPRVGRMSHRGRVTCRLTKHHVVDAHALRSARAPHVGRESPAEHHQRYGHARARSEPQAHRAAREHDK